jgi:small conductance mechanosensitive channel
MSMSTSISDQISALASALAAVLGQAAPVADVAKVAETATGSSWVGKVIANWDKPDQLMPLLRDGGIDFISMVALAALALFVTLTIAGWARKLVAGAMQRLKVDETLVRFLSNLVRYIVLVLGVLACLSTFGVNVTSFIAILSAAGFAVGLALQGTLAHLASGVMLLIFRPFKIGDLVTAGGQTGVVNEIDLFSTTMDTPDRRRIIIPNGAIFGATITNFTHHPVRIASAKVVVSAAASAEQARAVLLDAARRVIGCNQGAVADPAPGVSLAEMTGAGPAWLVTLAAKASAYDAVVEQITLEANAAVGQANIAPPLPVALVKNV